MQNLTKKSYSQDLDKRMVFTNLSKNLSTTTTTTATTTTTTTTTTTRKSTLLCKET